LNIFISHSSVNAGLAQKLCKDIEDAGHKCFIAPRDIRLGHEYASEIVIGIDNSDVMVLLLSKEANASPHILREVERAVSKSIPIILYKLEEVELSKSMEYFLMTHQWINASEAGFAEIVKSINELDGKNNKDDKPESTPVAEPQNKVFKSILPMVIGVSALVISIAIIVGSFIVKSGNKHNSESTMIEHNEDSSSEDNMEASIDSQTIKNAKLGEEVVFGRYNNADIVWYVIKISEDGKEAVLLSKDILTMKGFNPSKEKWGLYNGENQVFSDALAHTDMKVQAYAYGENSWETSTIRKWLNSSEKKVEYTDFIPESKRFADGMNGYDVEPGFLYNFTEEERNLIIEKTILTEGNMLSDKEIIETNDKVFLLSVDEVEWLKDAGISIFAKPTEEAIKQDETYMYSKTIKEGYETDTLLWRLRTPVNDSPSKCYMVSIDSASEPIDGSFYVGAEGFGIRPAITVDLTKLD